MRPLCGSLPQGITHSLHSATEARVPPGPIPSVSRRRKHGDGHHLVEVRPPRPPDPFPPPLRDEIHPARAEAKTHALHAVAIVRSLYGGASGRGIVCLGRVLTSRSRIIVVCVVTSSLSSGSFPGSSRAGRTSSPSAGVVPCA